MLCTLLIGSVLVLATPGEASPATDMAAYEAARAVAGRDPEAHVRLALWCEAHGLEAERMRHLAIAVLTDPGHATARALMGLVAFEGRWRRPEDVSRAVEAEGTLAEYATRRDRAADTADAYWKLALWCEEKGLKSEARAHLASVVRIDPRREAAWKRLGYKRQDGRWITDAQAAAEKAEAERQKKADRHWKPLLEGWRGGLADPKRRDAAEAALAGVTDPRAVPMIWAVFAVDNAARQAVAARVLGQIDAGGASRALALLAVFGRSAEVRRIATESLKRRDPREYAGLLVGMLRDKVKYEVRPVGGPGMPGALFIEGQRANLVRKYTPPSPPAFYGSRSLNGLWTYDANGVPIILADRRMSGYLGPDGSYAIIGSAAGLFAGQPHPASLQGIVHDPSQAGAILRAGGGGNLIPPAFALWQLEQRVRSGSNNPAPGTIAIGRAVLETQNAAARTQQQLMADVAALDRYNAEADELDTEIARVLNDATGQDLAPDPKGWRGWFVDQLGYAQRVSDSAKPTFVEEYAPQLPPVAGFDRNDGGYSRTTLSCFGAGTPVRTLAGLRPIETLKVGDRVLTQDVVKTGALGYRPILFVHRNPPSPTFRIALGGETIVSSHFHRFWKMGKGWVMARDLKPGDRVRTLDGTADVGTIEAGGVQPVFNLDVADDADFFVGRRGALVHDNTLPDLRLAPFDAEPSLATAAKPSPR